MDCLDLIKKAREKIRGFEIRETAVSINPTTYAILDCDGQEYLFLFSTEGEFIRMLKVETKATECSKCWGKGSIECPDCKGKGIKERR